MKKFLLRMIWMAAVLVFLGGTNAEVVLADNIDRLQGSCGENLTWVIDKEAGTMTITGSGKMDSWSDPNERSTFDTVILPEGLTEIASQALQNLSRSKRIASYIVDEKNAYFASEDGVLYTKDKKQLLAYPKAKPDTSFVVPDSVEEIHEGAFRCDHMYSYTGIALTEITLPANLKTIGPMAFYGCNMSKIVLPKSVNMIYGGVFGGCEFLTEIVVDRDVTEHYWNGYFSVDGVLYKRETYGERITLEYYPDGKTGNEFQVPSGVTMIGGWSFGNNKYLKTIKLPVTVTKLDYNALSSNEGIINYYIPSTASYDRDVFNTGVAGRTIYGKSGSPIYQFAMEHNIKFVETPDPAYAEPAEPFVFAGQKKPDSGNNGQTNNSQTGNGSQTGAGSQVPNGSQTENSDTVLTKEAGQKALKLSASSLPLQLKKKTKVLRVIGMASGDAVVKWESSKPKTVSVNTKTGQLKALKTGSAVITVTMKSGATASCTVKVQKSAVKTKKMTLSAKKIALRKGKSYTLTVEKTPLTAAEKLKFTTSDKKIAAVTPKGVIKAKKKGKVTITVQSGKVKKSCRVTVK